MILTAHGTGTRVTHERSRLMGTQQLISVSLLSEPLAR